MTRYVVKFTDPWGSICYIQHGSTNVKDPTKAKLYETYEAAAEIAECCRKAARKEIKPYGLELKHQRPGMKTNGVPGYAADAKVCKVTFAIEEM